ncbi:MAG: tetratricopeptide repeat protein [Phycisphaerae bacterium]|nr:tetratricopeptide repeat protein [Phycisphaerae bacterium]
MVPAVVLAALIMGAPTLRGTFVGGDDYRLVLNHVLVSRPSLAHAVELFRIVHRDLYQPLPLLSFSAEFAVAKVFGLFERGVDAGAWLFHLDNVLLHALNAVLAFLLIRRLASEEPRAETNHGEDRILSNGTASTPATGDYIAFVAALLFAVHPLQVEVVAWINGRMMLLSTLFALATLLALCRWMRTPSPLWSVLVPFFALCCAISKIRVELPLLMLLVPLAFRRRPRHGFWLIWAASTAITAAFTWINLQATDEAGMFEGAEKNLLGPGLARGLISLGWYFEHFVWPRGLASWYPAPGTVSWTEPLTLRAMLIVVPVLGFATWCVWKLRPAALGFAWFLAAIAATLQVVPTRNALAADRYMYLPIVGLVWVVGVVLLALYCRAAKRVQSAVLRIGVAVAGGIIVAASIAQSWHVASFYDNPVVKSRRIADLFPDAQHVWERAAWALYNVGNYQEAIDLARRELRHEDPRVRSEAHEAVGAALIKLGRFDEALSELGKGLELASDRGGPHYRLGWAYEEMGCIDEAIPYYEKAVEIAPLKNPWIVRLASLYRDRGRPADARRLYEQALRNNPYEVPAILGLAELDIAAGTPEKLAAAERSLLSLLDWYGDDPAAWANLGVIRARTGHVKEAIDAYQQALAIDPLNAVAAANLGQLYESMGNIRAAEQAYKAAEESPGITLDQAVVIHNFYLREGRPEEAVTMWDRIKQQLGSGTEAKAYANFARNLTTSMPRPFDPGKHDNVGVSEFPPELGPDTAKVNHPFEHASYAYYRLLQGAPRWAAKRADWLCESAGNASDGPAAKEQFLLAMGIAAARLPESPWPYCLAARVQLCGDDPKGAAPMIEICAQRCHDDECRDYADRLKKMLGEL